ncbi:hypothetical protein BCU68_05875 [Vibrio sp. 10N.286.49.B3]|uniref:porin n=1 Tax=Vibrio sp. 10N.286.49.B3 TaxID=1880855 RepID=UPI000C845554|nr:porin [Vibrio sp. 10N.286.49.B3]PMH41206.1 hypothetical protein BCU68_05875 [Vibrio sp. 10N.286.49.B3]
MKKTVIALTVAAAALTTGANAAEVYNKDGNTLSIGGRAEFRGDFGGTESGDKIDGTMDNKSRFRLNVGGTTQITDNLSGIGFYEAEQTVKSSGDNDAESSFNQRYLFAGLQGDFGAVTFGRQDTAAVQVSQMSDTTTYTGAQKGFIAASNEQINNTIAYSGEFLNALTVKASYIAGSEKDTDGYGISAIYRLPMGLGFGLGYSAGENDDNATIVGVNYDVDAFFLGATYTGGDIDKNNDFKGVELSGKYYVNNEFTVMAAYQKNKAEESASPTERTEFVEIAADYAFNSTLNSYVAYRLDNESGHDNSLRLGLMYAF